MDVQVYLSIRRSYNLLRQVTPLTQRITFEELAILSVLHEREFMHSSEIADYQNISRPTTTHRGNHLFKLGFISRVMGAYDRRQVCCSITDEGRAEVSRLLSLMINHLTEKPSRAPLLSRLTVERMRKQIVAMGVDETVGANQVLLPFSFIDPDESDRALSVSKIVDQTGLLQPTVSMTVTRFVEQGILERVTDQKSKSRKATSVQLTQAGFDELTASLEGIESMKSVITPLI